jgi:hypothetical protein
LTLNFFLSAISSNPSIYQPLELGAGVGFGLASPSLPDSPL